MKIGDTSSGQGGTKAEPTFRKGFGIAEIHQSHSIYIITNPIIFIRYLDMIPLVCLQQMVGICIFFQDCGTGFCICNSRFVAVITAKTCSRIMIPTVSHIVKLQGITVQKDAITPFLTFPDIIGVLRVRSHPKTIQVTQAIAFCLNNDTRIVLNGYLATHLFFSPKS